MTTPLPPVPPLDHAAIGNGRVLAAVTIGELLEARDGRVRAWS